MPTFNADQIIGKTLIAKKPIDIYRSGTDGANVVYTVSTGQSIGKVFSYLLPGSNRNNLYWQYVDSNGRYYYTMHEIGAYDVKDLQDQGALTIQEQQQAAEAAAAAEAEANLPLTDKILKLVKNIAMIGAGAYLLNTLLNKKL